VKASTAATSTTSAGASSTSKARRCSTGSPRSDAGRTRPHRGVVPRGRVRHDRHCLRNHHAVRHCHETGSHLSWRLARLGIGGLVEARILTSGVTRRRRRSPSGSSSPGFFAQVGYDAIRTLPPVTTERSSPLLSGGRPVSPRTRLLDRAALSAWLVLWRLAALRAERLLAVPHRRRGVLWGGLLRPCAGSSVAIAVVRPARSGSASS
jgi:hypothetical protein